jgi:hypothetical protein
MEVILFEYRGLIYSVSNLDAYNAKGHIYIDFDLYDTRGELMDYEDTKLYRAADEYLFDTHRELISELVRDNQY